MTYNENVLRSGVLLSQVRRMLTELRLRKEIGYIRLVSFISPRLWWRERRGFKELGRELARANIDFRVSWMLAAQSWNWLAIPMIVLFCFPILLAHLINGSFNIIHCRSYGAGLLGFLTSRFTGTRYVFDPRDPYPDELVINGSWTENGITYRLWKKIESVLIRKSDCVIGVTPDYRDVFRKQGARRSYFVPNRGDVARFTPDSNIAPTGKPVFLFTGDMSGGWYPPRQVAIHFLKIKSAIPDLRLKLVTVSDPEMVRAELRSAGLDDNDWTIESARPEEMPGKIAGATFGLILALKPTGNWPVKYAEYLAAGVPVVVEHEVGQHITRPVDRWGMGIVLNDDDERIQRQAIEIIDQSAVHSQRCLSYARLKLDISHTAQQFARIYRQLSAN